MVKEGLIFPMYKLRHILYAAAVTHYFFHGLFPCGSVTPVATALLNSTFNTPNRCESF